MAVNAVAYSVSSDSVENMFQTQKLNNGKLNSLMNHVQQNDNLFMNELTLMNLAA